MRSGRLGYLSQCPHISGSHQRVLRYTHASHCTGTHPRLERGSLGGADKAEAPVKQRRCLKRACAILQAVLGCSGRGAAPPPSLRVLSAFSPQRSISISDSSAFGKFCGIISWCHPQPPLSPAHDGETNGGIILYIVLLQLSHVCRGQNKHLLQPLPTQ